MSDNIISENKTLAKNSDLRYLNGNNVASRVCQVCHFKMTGRPCIEEVLVKVPGNLISKSHTF